MRNKSQTAVSHLSNAIPAPPPLFSGDIPSSTLQPHTAPPGPGAFFSRYKIPAKPTQRLSFKNPGTQPPKSAVSYLAVSHRFPLASAYPRFPLQDLFAPERQIPLLLLLQQFEIVPITPTPTPTTATAAPHLRPAPAASTTTRPAPAPSAGLPARSRSRCSLTRCRCRRRCWRSCWASS
jgi:hypothetical protein